MVDRVNGGIEVGQVLSGSLRHFKIETNAAALVDGLGDPNAAVEVLVELLATKGTPVIINVATEFMYVAFEMGSTAWTAADLQTDIRALGATVGADSLDFSTAVVTEPGYVLA